MPSIIGQIGAGSGLPAPSEFGVLGNSDTGPGVVGFSRTGVALEARSVSGNSGSFTSDTGDGLVSFVNSPYRAAITGIAASQTGTGVYGNGETGVYGSSNSGVGVWGDTNSAAAVHGRCLGSYGFGVVGEVIEGGYAIYGFSNAGGYAGLFQGNVLMGGHVYIYGSLSKPGGSFRIDHPLDPGNKYLSHSFVESPDMLNVYNGLVQLDDQGAAIVEFPEWFDALNHEFRYQLTPIGSPAPGLHVASEIARRSFRIAGGTPKGKVSWQVTGIRKDKWANANRIQVEEDKPSQDRGYYLHPELYGEPEDKKVMPGPRPTRSRAPHERPVHPSSRP